MIHVLGKGYMMKIIPHYKITIQSIARKNAKINEEDGVYSLLREHQFKLDKMRPDKVNMFILHVILPKGNYHLSDVYKHEKALSSTSWAEIRIRCTGARPCGPPHWEAHRSPG